MRVLLMSSHAVEEHDQLQLMHDIGHEVFSIGSYIHPSLPMDPKREALPQIPEQTELIAAVDALGQQGHSDTLGEAKKHLPDAVLEWAEVIIISAYERDWLQPQWPRMKAAGKRVIWRTIGQSGDRNELDMQPFFEEGVEIVRYSPKERNIPNFAGESAMIRFWKDPAEWHGWTGEDAVVTNVSQSMVMRDPWCNAGFWVEATQGLPTRAIGSDSEALGGLGQIPLAQMQEQLRKCRVYLYTGTQPASYTLGLIEAMMTGIPTVSIGSKWMGILPYGGQIFEGPELTGLSSNEPGRANQMLAELLVDDDLAAKVSAVQRQRAIDLFSKEQIQRQWAEYLVPVRERELVAA